MYMAYQIDKLIKIWINISRFFLWYNDFKGDFTVNNISFRFIHFND